MAQENKKVRFIRKNGRVIPIPIKAGDPHAMKKGGGAHSNKKSKSKSSKKSKFSDSSDRAERHSLNEGKGDFYKSKSRRLSKKVKKNNMLSFIGGAAASLVATRGKKKLLAAGVGVGASLLSGLLQGKSKKKAASYEKKGKKFGAKADKDLDVIYKRGHMDTLGDGRSRRAYTRGYNSQKNSNGTSF